MSFFKELQRRNVFKVGIAYAVTAWLLWQIVELVVVSSNAPDWVMLVFMLGMAAGFPIVIIVAWAYELTPDGIKLEKNVERSQSINRHTGHQLNRGIIMILAMAVVLWLTDRFRDELFGHQEAGDAKEDTTNIPTDNPDLVDSEKSMAGYDPATDLAINVFDPLLENRRGRKSPQGSHSGK